MADNVAVTAGSGTTIGADEVTDGTLGTVKVQYVKLMDGTLDGTSKAAVSASGLKVDLGADNDVVVTNAGTFAVQESGGALTALQIIDDWDESDRAKVNLIVGQAGIAAGAGAVGVTVPRVTLASDDPGVALLTTIDADTGSMATLLGTIDADTSTLAGAVSGTEMQVDVVAALPSGSNTIGAVTNTHLTNALIGEYETVAASQTDQALGATGGTGDYLAGVLIVPATTSPGAVSIKDGAGSAITIFTGGASSVSNLVPFMIPLGITSAAGAWQITTGANVSAIGIGNFT